MRLRVFGSGSGGNCLAVRSRGGAAVLVDCGLSHRQLNSRARACGFDIDAVSAVLFTHDHSDHYAGLETFHKRHPQVVLYANGDTTDAIASATHVQEDWAVFETGVPFDVADLTVTPFSISHDAADPVGFLLEDGETTLFIGTDTGVVTTGFRAAFARADAAVLESNHDPMLLEASDRPISLKQRIRGRSGHLSNEDAAELVRTVNPARLRLLLLAHISEQCNAPHLARETMAAALAGLGRADIRLETLSQDEPSDLFEF